MDPITRSDDERLQRHDIRIADHQVLRESLRAALSRAEAAESALCRAREEWAWLSRHFEIPKGRPPSDTLEANLVSMDAALTSSSPCAHAEEAKRLKEAEEWACEGHYHNYSMIDFAKELRRRSEGGK